MIGGGLRFWRWALVAAGLVVLGIVVLIIGITVSTWLAGVILPMTTGFVELVLGIFCILIPSFIGLVFCFILFWAAIEAWEER